MTREELFELAALDAYGLLDEYEAALFTRSFHHASATVQHELRELQASIAANPVLVPDVEPRESLRIKVLESVAARIEAESAKLAPLATIGSLRAQAGHSDGRVVLGASGQFWRAASFLLAASVLVVLYFSVEFYQQSKKLTAAVIDGYTDVQIEEIIGPAFSAFANDPSCVRIDLRSIEGSRGQHAVVYINEDTNESFLFVLGLPAHQEYTLAAFAEDDTDGLKQVFHARDAVSGVNLGELSAAFVASLSALTWEIADGSGAVLLRSA